VIRDVVGLFRCPRCDSGLSARGPDRDRPEALVCQSGHTVPIVDGIPRFVDVPATAVAKRTQASFGYEWTHFNDWRQSGEINFNDYFKDVDLRALIDRSVLDAGCGMGRHARQIAPFAASVVAVDFSSAIDQAARNTATCGSVTCIQADLLALPFRNASFDFVYSLGVLHHLPDTDGAVRVLTSTLKPGGRLRVYLYWKRYGWQGQLLRAVTAARQVTTRLPFPILRVFCWALSVALFGAVVAPYRFLSRIGVRRHQSWPLFVYTKYPFRVLYNDQFDRFSAPIEKRYDAEEIRDLLARAGLTDIRVEPCFGWIADAVKPSSPIAHAGGT
jgi:SAM-dependent methyltransferase